MLPWLVCKTNPLASKLLAAKPVLLIQHITQGFSNTQPGTPSILIVKKKNDKKPSTHNNCTDSLSTNVFYEQYQTIRILGSLNMHNNIGTGAMELQLLFV